MLKVLELKNWQISKTKEGCFTYINIVAPSGYRARICKETARNPENILYHLAQDILDARQVDSSNKA